MRRPNPLHPAPLWMPLCLQANFWRGMPYVTPIPGERVWVACLDGAVFYIGQEIKVLLAIQNVVGYLDDMAKLVEEASRYALTEEEQKELASIGYIKCADEARAILGSLEISLERLRELEAQARAHYAAEIVGLRRALPPAAARAEIERRCGHRYPAEGRCARRAA